MLVSHAVRILAEYFLLPLMPDIENGGKLLTMGIIIVLTAVIIIYSKINKYSLSVFSVRFSWLYIMFTCIVAGVY